MAHFDLSWIRARLAQYQPESIDSTLTPRRAAVAIILRQSRLEHWDLLFIRRTTNPEDPWSGHMAFPGGRLDEDDLSPLHAAIRETREEVNIDLEQDAQLLGTLDEFHASARGRVLPLAVSPFVFLLEKPATIRCNCEVEEALWIPVTQFFDPHFTTTVPYQLEGKHFELPGYDIEGRIIWGLTFYMLGRLFTLLQWEIAS